MHDNVQEILELKEMIYSMEKKINDIMEKIEEIVNEESKVLEDFTQRLKKLDELDNIKRSIEEIKLILNKKKIIW